MTFPQTSQLHLWYAKLDEDLYQSSNIKLLDAEEVKRATRFHFELHRKRFITARAGLRSILSLYLGISPQSIHFSLGPAGKPFVENTELQFNLSHSHDVALYAFTFQMPVGVDIEKVRSNYNDAVAKRFFSSEEYEQFSKLAQDQKRVDFYRIWTGKEALVKALGEGLRFPLSSFSLPAHPGTKEISLKDLTPPQTWFLENVDLFPGYQASLATNKMLTQLSYFEWTPQGERKWREDELRSSS